MGQLLMDDMEQMIHAQKVLDGVVDPALLHDAHINGKAGVMLGMAGLCHIFIGIFQAEFIQVIIKRADLGFDGTVSGDQLRLDTVIFQKILPQL